MSVVELMVSAPSLKMVLVVCLELDMQLQCEIAPSQRMGVG